MTPTKIFLWIIAALVAVFVTNWLFNHVDVWLAWAFVIGILYFLIYKIQKSYEKNRSSADDVSNPD